MMTQDDEIAGLLLRWEEAWEHGQDIPPSVLCADHPGLEPAVRQRIEALKATAWVKEPPKGGEDDEDEVERIGPLPRMLGGRYRIEGLVADGGHGRVYRARAFRVKGCLCQLCAPQIIGRSQVMPAISELCEA